MGTGVELKPNRKISFSVSRSSRGKSDKKLNPRSVESGGEKFMAGKCRVLSSLETIVS